MDAKTRAALIHALIVADRRQKSNPYALAHYCSALQNVETLITEGVSLREALMTCYCGRLVNTLVKAAGLTPLTDDELRRVR